MARPLKNNADWFSHDADMRNNLKVKALRRRFGHEGYAVWCYLLEALTNADYFELKYDDLQKELLAADFNTTPEILDEIVSTCIKLGMLNIDDDRLYSEGMRERMSRLIESRKSVSDRVKRFREKQRLSRVTIEQNKNCNEDVTRYNPHSIVEYSIEDNSKENINNSLSISPSLESGGLSSAERENIFSIFFFKGFARPEYETEEFINHYTARNWTPNNSTKQVNTARGRMALARNWSPKTGMDRWPNCSACLHWLSEGYYKAVERLGADKAGTILRDIADIKPIPNENYQYAIWATRQVYEIISAAKVPLEKEQVEGIKWMKSAKQVRLDNKGKSQT